MIKKILGSKQTFGLAGYEEQDILQMDKFRIKNVYQRLRGDMPNVEWRRLTCNNHGLPRWKFILYLAIHGRLLTKDRIAKWATVNEPSCPLCCSVDESLNHLFFTCPYSSIVWGKMLAWQGIIRTPADWSAEVVWAIGQAKGRSVKAILYRIVLACCLYFVWQERNFRLHQRKRREPEVLLRQIAQEVHCRGSLLPRLHSRLAELSYYP
ncbi:uncharacterized protein LOC132038358 [Lycium ferocissimum]|uniref:uncharacterized protein LOC132038358 n=1 Tax=Lycium ferocissimum TaxID=112874 RepID=UPI0028161BF1|nr:uncharacterized protein LOC132038358 [Lycium ferocissimum]